MLPAADVANAGDLNRDFVIRQVDRAALAAPASIVWPAAPVAAPLPGQCRHLLLQQLVDRLQP